MPRTESAAGVSRALLSAALAAGLLIQPAIGAAPWLLREKAAVKSEARERLRGGLEEAAIVTLSFTLEESRTVLRWEDEQEFEYEGRMYDVVETRVEGGTVSYRCWRDEEETRLNERLKELACRELGEAADPDSDEDGPGSPRTTSLGAVVFDWMASSSGPHRLRRLSPRGYLSIAFGPPTPPPWPA
jgi:hypothetical protein